MNPFPPPIDPNTAESSSLTKRATDSSGAGSSSNIYQPSIYGYTCRGAYYASSDEQRSDGKCRGLRTRLELLSDMEPNTREGAIKDFTFMTDFELDEEDANALNQKTKSILVSPALIFKEPIHEGDGEKVPSTQLPEEELIKRQSWSCYGSTDVEYLVLKNETTGEEHIAAVSPHNVGVSVRKIQAEDGSITSVGIGWLNIVLDAGPSLVDDQDEEETKQPAGKKKAPQRSPNYPNGSNPLPDEIPPRPSAGSISNAKEHLGNFYNFTGKVATHMGATLTWLFENLQDDFPARTFAAGSKITSNIPKTVEKTGAFMERLISKWRRGGDDDPDHGGPP